MFITSWWWLIMTIVMHLVMLDSFGLGYFEGWQRTSTNNGSFPGLPGWSQKWLTSWFGRILPVNGYVIWDYLNQKPYLVVRKEHECVIIYGHDKLQYYEYIRISDLFGNHSWLIIMDMSISGSYLYSHRESTKPQVSGGIPWHTISFISYNAWF